LKGRCKTSLEFEFIISALYFGYKAVIKEGKNGKENNL